MGEEKKSSGGRKKLEEGKRGRRGDGRSWRGRMKIRKKEYNKTTT